MTVGAFFKGIPVQVVVLPSGEASSSDDRSNDLQRQFLQVLDDNATPLAKRVVAFGALGGISSNSDPFLQDIFAKTLKHHPVVDIIDAMAGMRNTTSKYRLLAAGLETLCSQGHKDESLVPRVLEIVEQVREGAKGPTPEEAHKLRMAILRYIGKSDFVPDPGKITSDPLQIKSSLEFLKNIFKHPSKEERASALHLLDEWIRKGEKTFCDDDKKLLCRYVFFFLFVSPFVNTPLMMTDAEKLSDKEKARGLAFTQSLNPLFQDKIRPRLMPFLEGENVEYQAFVNVMRELQTEHLVSPEAQREYRRKFDFTVEKVSPEKLEDCLKRALASEEFGEFAKDVLEYRKQLEANIYQEANEEADAVKAKQTEAQRKKEAEKAKRWEDSIKELMKKAQGQEKPQQSQDSSRVQIQTHKNDDDDSWTQVPIRESHIANRTFNPLSSKTDPIPCTPHVERWLLFRGNKLKACLEDNKENKSLKRSENTENESNESLARHLCPFRDLLDSSPTPFMDKYFFCPNEHEMATAGVVFTFGDRLKEKTFVTMQLDSSKKQLSHFCVRGAYEFDKLKQTGMVLNPSYEANQSAGADREHVVGEEVSESNLRDITYEYQDNGKFPGPLTVKYSVQSSQEDGKWIPCKLVIFPLR